MIAKLLEENLTNIRILVNVIIISDIIIIMVFASGLW